MIGVKYEAKTFDFIKKISDVERYVKDLRVDRRIVQQYNIERSKNMYLSPNKEIEHYSSKNMSDYYTDLGFSSKKEVTFSTGDFNNDMIGYVETIIAIKYNKTRYNYLSPFFYDKIEELKNKQKELLIDCFNDEYLEKII